MYAAPMMYILTLNEFTNAPLPYTPSCARARIGNFWGVQFCVHTHIEFPPQIKPGKKKHDHAHSPRMNQ